MLSPSRTLLITRLAYFLTCTLHEIVLKHLSSSCILSSALLSNMDSTGDTSNLTPGAANRETMEQGLPGHPHQEQGQTHQHMPPPSFYQSLVPAAARAHHTSYGGSPIGNTSLMLNHGYPAMSFYQNPAHYPANQIINPGHPHVPYQSGHAGSLPASYLSHHTSFGGGQTSSITYPFTGYYAARPGYPEAQLSSTGHTTLSHVRSYHMPQSPQRVPVYGSHHDLKQVSCLAVAYCDLYQLTYNSG